MSLGYLKSLEALEAALRLGSLKDAATELGVTPAAVGQRVRALENHLATDLIVRGRSGISPTPALSEAIPHLGRAFAELRSASDALNIQRSDEIHIAANSDWVQHWLAPRLPRFRRDYPNIRFCINGEGDAPTRIGQSDIEVTFAARADGAQYDLLFPDYLVPIASPENEERVKRQKKPLSLDGLPLLHLDFYKDDPDAMDWPAWIKRYGYRTDAPSTGIRFQRLTDGLEAIYSSAGFLICGLALLKDCIEDRSIRMPYPIEYGGWTSFAYRARFKNAIQRGPLREFRNWMQQEAKATSAWIEERAGSVKWKSAE